MLAALHTTPAQSVEAVAAAAGRRQASRARSRAAEDEGGARRRSSRSGRRHGSDDDDVQRSAGVKLVHARVDGLEKGALRGLSDSLRDRLGSGVVVLASDSRRQGRAGRLGVEGSDRLACRPAASSRSSRPSSAAAAAAARTSPRPAARTRRRSTSCSRPRPLSFRQLASVRPVADRGLTRPEPPLTPPGESRPIPRLQNRMRQRSISKHASRPDGCKLLIPRGHFACLACVWISANC